MPLEFETLNTDVIDQHILLVTFSRPEVHNAFNTQMCHDLLNLFLFLVHEAHDFRCILLTGAGEKAFSAGGDLKERQGMSDDAWRAQHVLFERLIREIWDCPVPVIAAVNGVAFGGGTEVALACDFILASDNARFALTETSLGIMPGAGGTQNLPRAVGMRFAKEMIFTACRVGADEALSRGLVNRVFTVKDFRENILDIAKSVCTKGPLSIKQAKKSIQTGAQMNYRDALYFEVATYNQLIGTEDRLEGVNAFNEKRPPIFKGK